MKKLSKNQWIAAGAGIVIIVIYFYNQAFFYSLLFPGNEMNSSNESANGSFNQSITENQMETNGAEVAGTSASSDVKIVDLKVGTGKVAQSGSNVAINYLGTFLNGTKFDSSYDRGVPLEFQVGSGQLIPGFDKGVMGMKVGGKRKVTIPPELAYGAAGYPPVIPPNSTLIFEIELVAVK